MVKTIPEMKSCLGCKKYRYCLALCPEAARYVSQDEGKQQELTIGIPIFAKRIPIRPAKITLSETQRKLGKLLARKINRRIISSLTGIPLRTVSNQVWQMKKIYFGDDFLPMTPHSGNL